MSKKLICFSLWGNHEFYNYGALENAILAQSIYPDWICRFYYLDNCDPKIIKELGKLKNVELVEFKSDGQFANTFWRFIPAFEDDNIIFISRDTDSRLNIKEKNAVDEWLASDKDFHIMRDHYYHDVLIMAGMWGCRNNILKPFREEFRNFNKRGDIRDSDQVFLREIIYPKIVDKSIVHASSHKKEKHARDFPKSFYDGFVGEYIRYAPYSFKLLGEKDRLLNTFHDYQKM
jgi:protein O-GlcNAc transferase